MSEKIKKIICCLTACAVLTFSCVFCPRQRAEAFVLAPVVGTVAGLFALGLLAYGVSTSSDSDFVQDNAEAWASSNGFFSDPTQSIMNTICASLFLSSIKGYAELAYSSGFCSTTIQGPVKLPDIPSDSLRYFKVSNGVVLSSSSLNGFLYPPYDSTLGSFSSGFLGTYNSSSGYTEALFIANGGLYIAHKLSGKFIFESSGFFGICIKSGGGGYCRYRSITPDNYITVFNSMYSDFNLNNYNTPFKNADQYFSYMINVWNHFGATNNFESVQAALDYLNSNPTWSSHPGSISADVSSKPVIPGACDVFNSSKSLDSYHVDSPGNDVLDLGNLLDKTGCETIDDVVSKVYTGDLSSSDVIGGLDCRPYVDVDVDTGTIAIPNETTNSRPISLDKDLSIPSDIADTDTYEPANPPKDDTTTDKPSLPKGAYAFPLADYFPFCLPFDLYRFCTLFVATPKTPEITLDFSTFLPFLDKENPEQYVYTFDLHSLDRLAEIIRTLELFGIVLGIGLITRRIIGW